MRQLPASDNPLYINGDDSSETLTLDAAETMTARLASGLYHAAGVRPGHVVAIVMPNSIYYLPIILAVLTLGATCTLANPAYTARELAHQLGDSQARLVITIQALHPTVTEATGELANGDIPVLLADGDESSLFDILSDRHVPLLPLDSVDGNSTAFIPYSSGTSGLPKGVKLSHRNIISNILQTTAVHQTAAADCRSATIAVLPMFHIFGLLFLCFLMPISGMTTVITRKFDMSQFLSLVKEHRVTETMLVPPI
ncbi:4-coumarate--CoA ligase, partial [Coemansia aciculifera]